MVAEAKKKKSMKDADVVDTVTIMDMTIMKDADAEMNI